MYINEAARSRTKEKPFITREAWNEGAWIGSKIRIYPTNTPDCCIIDSTASKIPCRGWQPQAEDLIADDWIATD